MRKEKKLWLNTPVEDLKRKFLEDLQDKKRIQALQHLAEVRKFRQQSLLKVVADDYKNGFLDPEESQFLEYVVRKYSIDYLNWCHKTRGTKIEMAQMKARLARKTKQKSKRNVENTKIVQLPLFPELPTLEKQKSSFGLSMPLLKRPSFKRWLRA